MAVLICMAERPGEVVTRDEFAEIVWKDRVVSDEVLSRNISLLRSHFDDVWARYNSEESHATAE